jgi:hypothetical protein
MSAGALAVVPSGAAWFLGWRGLDRAPRLFSCWREALRDLLYRPDQWPEDPCFWLELQSLVGEKPILGYVPEKMKRHQWHNVRVVALMRKSEINYTKSTQTMLFSFASSLFHENAYFCEVREEGCFETRIGPGFAYQFGPNPGSCRLPIWGSQRQLP